MTGAGPLFPLPQGPPPADDYRALVEHRSFKRMEAFSDAFIGRHGKTLAGYGRRWVADPFHQWSRQWEYPFVHAALRKAAANRGEGPFRVLDAGSGATFFPWYIAADVEGAEVTCCDRDPSLPELFDTVNRTEGTAIEFLACDLARTGIGEGSRDAVYAISVLEHSEDREPVVRELARLLKPGGILVVTFDISLDGLGEIVPEELDGMVGALGRVLAATDGRALERLLDREELRRPDLVTTTAAGLARDLLPWRHPLLSTLAAALRRGRLPRRIVREFTFSCHVFRKPAGEGGP